MAQGIRRVSWRDVSNLEISLQLVPLHHLGAPRDVIQESKDKEKPGVKDYTHHAQVYPTLEADGVGRQYRLQPGERLGFVLQAQVRRSQDTGVGWGGDWEREKERRRGKKSPRTLLSQQEQSS